MKYAGLDLGTIEATFNILGGIEGAARLRRGELVLVEAPKPEPIPEPQLDFPVWKTVKLGTNLKTADDFRSAIKQAKMKIGDWGNDILGNPAFTVSETEMNVDLVNVSVADLGFKDGAYRRDIIAKALSLGLELCPAEVGPALRLQYADQPKGEWLVIGMEPITASDGNLGVFDVGHGYGERWLNGHNGNSDNFWDAVGRFVFVRPSK
jgi:hypothetical protein